MLVKKRTKMKTACSVVTSAVLALSLALTPGGAAMAEEVLVDDAVANDAATDEGVPEWAVDDGADEGEAELTVQAALPSKYDLRSDGLVTPVKCQSPWGACWAFAGIAAAETSMLSATGFKYDKQTNDVDLSERHLAYFALHPVTEVDDPAQAGEGMYTMSTDRNAAFDAGGMPVYITTLFSQGVGPQAEAMFPYRGVDAQGKSRLGTQAFESDPEGTTLLLYASAEGMTADEYKKNLEKEAEAQGTTYEELLKPKMEEAKKYCEGDSTYFYLDDWTIPATDGSGNSNRTLTPFMTLRDGNVLPGYQNTDNTPNAQSIAAMKQELVNGHGVTISYKPDKARPSESGDSRYINRDTWAQYTFEIDNANHAVCIVGYDDNYSRENFKHEVDGVDPELTMPPGDGAWIVKNSWGSETDQTTDDLGNVINNGTYGVRDENGKATGYFYLSYYDKNISQPETMTFSSDLLDDAGDFEVLQHDYMAAQSSFYTTPATADVTSSANVFEAPQDLSIKAVSTRTSEENQRVTFAIYELRDGATNPADGTLLYRTSRNFEYAGFHRLDLDWALEVRAGKKIAVVSTASTLDSGGTRLYSASANQAFSKQSVEFLNGLRWPVTVYGEAVVNEGESFLYSNGQWVDWSKHIAALPKSTEEFAPGLPFPGDSYIEQFPIDNFSIKLYAEPIQIAEEAPADLSAAEVTVAKATYNGGKAVKPRVTVKLDGATLAEGTDYTLSYNNNKKAGTAVAIVKGVGAYTGSAAQTFTIAKASVKNAKVAKVAKVANRAYTSKKVVPAPKVTFDGVALKKGTDYTLSYANNVKVGTATITVTGKGNYTGTKKVTFKIVAPTCDCKGLCQGKTWVGANKSTGIIGTVGQSKGLEGLKITPDKSFPVKGGIAYRSHVQGTGWEKTWSADGKVSGKAGKRTEAVQIKLTGAMAKQYDVYYRAHVQQLGWMGWAKNGESAGTTGHSYRLEALQIVYVPKGGKAPAATYQGVARQTTKAFIAK